MNKNEQKVIIVAYASTGSGHQSAAEAIYQHLKEHTNHVVFLVDALDYYCHKINGNTVMNRLNGILAPIFDVSWRKNFTGRLSWAGGKLWPEFLFQKMGKYINEKNPDLIICTHFVCANAAVLARQKANKYYKIISVPTDYETEGLWPHKQTNLFCVSNDIMKQTLMQRRVNKNQIITTGIPVNNNFTANYNKNKIFDYYNIPKGKKIVVVIAGAHENGPYKNFRKIINKSLNSLSKIKDTYFLICVGKDAKYAQKLHKLCRKTFNVRIVAYAKNLARLMYASDLAIIKAGGLILSECVAMNLPFIIVGKTYAQESINRLYFTSENVTRHITSSKGLTTTIENLLDNPKTYNAIKNKLSKLKNENSAKKIVNASLNLLNDEKIQNKHLNAGVYISDSPMHTW